MYLEVSTTLTLFIIIFGTLHDKAVHKPSNGNIFPTHYINIVFANMFPRISAAKWIIFSSARINLYNNSVICWIGNIDNVSFRLILNVVILCTMDVVFKLSTLQIWVTIIIFECISIFLSIKEIIKVRLEFIKLLLGIPRPFLSIFSIFFFKLFLIHRYVIEPFPFVY